MNRTLLPGRPYPLGATLSSKGGEPILDDSFLLVVNAAHEGVEFTVPPSPSGKAWLQSLTENVKDPFVRAPVADKIIMGGRALKLLSDAAAD